MVPHLNQIAADFAAEGLRVVSANHLNSPAEIQTFMTTFGTAYSIVRVNDSAGYSFVGFVNAAYAVSRDGRILWSGNLDNLDDAMIAQWIDPGTVDQGGCTSRNSGDAPLWSILVGLIGAAALRRHRRGAR